MFTFTHLSLPYYEYPGLEMRAALNLIRVRLHVLALAT